MLRSKIKSAWLLSSFMTLGMIGGASSQDFCTGSDCLVISSVRLGTRCGSRDSVEVDILNASSSLNLRGYVVFTRPDGTRNYAPTGLLAPGQTQQGVQFDCHASSDVRGIANVGANPTYPEKR
jgi:hypothetical protein